MAGKFELVVRRNLPTGIRHILRLGRHAVAKKREPSPDLPPELLTDCRVCASRYDLLKVLPHGGRIVEVGTYKGDFAKHILATCNPTELHLVDLDFSLVDAAVMNDARVTRHVGQSHDTLAGFPNDHFDWIYIDADHSFAATTRDAFAAAPKVKPGGYLVFNDFAHVDMYLGAYGVHRAVMEFAIKQKWPLAWLAYDAHALYDVALQRPLSRSN